MIAVRLEGRLGNQLFQYAFIYCTSKKLKTKFYLDKSIDNLIVDKYFDVNTGFTSFFDKKIFAIKGFKNIFSYHLKNAFYNLLKNIFRLKIITFASELSAANQNSLISDHSLYCGFFQSEDFFEEFRDDILEIFTVKIKCKKQFEYIFQSLPAAKTYVVVHVRRGDYIAHNFALTPDYYHRAIQSVHKEENFYIFISDDVEFVAQEFGYIEKKFLSKNEEIIDFQFISCADICILSNSSFSWWGAYLNARKTTVIAPRYWLGETNCKEYPVGVLPDSWVKFD